MDALRGKNDRLSPAKGGSGVLQNVTRACLTLLLAAVVPGTAFAEDLPAQSLLGEVALSGVRTVPEATIRSRIGSQVGAPYDPEQISRDIRSLFETGLFENITVDAEQSENGLRITFLLAEQPLVRNLVFEGHGEVFSTTTLTERAGVVSGKHYSAVAAGEAAARIVALYQEQGYYRAAVRTRAEPAVEGRVDLHFVVEAGEKYRLTTVRFDGARAFAEDVLRTEMRSGAWSLFSSSRHSGTLQRSVLAEDCQRIVTFYQDHGYLEIRVGEPQIMVDERARSIEVLIPLNEGPQFRLGALSLQGDDLVALEEIRGFFGIKEGEVFRRSAFVAALFEINRRYTSTGYAFVKVDYYTLLEAKKKMISVTFLVERGPEARIGLITVSGNIATRDRVIARQLAFHEGDLFDSDALRRSRQKIFDLGFFDAVDFVPKPRADNAIDVDIVVKERLTGAVRLGVMYSTEEKLVGQAGVFENNLLGSGKSLQLTAEYGAIRQDYSFTFSNPAFLDSPWTLGIDLYDHSRDKEEYDEYSLGTFGGAVTWGRTLPGQVRGSLSLTREWNIVSDIDEGASEYYHGQEGRYLTDSLRFALNRDTRDTLLRPNSGSNGYTAFEVAGDVLGGETSFTKLEVGLRVYRTFFGSIIGTVSGRYGQVIGVDGRETPVYEKFFPGGIDTIRGFPLRSVGPKDEGGHAVGGDRELLLNADVYIPVAAERKFELALFYDAGNAWARGEAIAISELRQSVGFGFGGWQQVWALHLEGYLVRVRIFDPEDDESPWTWLLSFGSPF